MFNRNAVAFSQFAPRRTYRDIPEQYDRMGQMVPGMTGFAPSFGAIPGAFPGFAALAGPDAALAAASCGALPCCPVPQPTNAYERVVGLPRVCIPGCDCETVETSVCGPFTLTGIYIAPKVAHFLSITRLQVGCNNILVNCDPIPAELFSCCEIDENVITAPTVDSNSPICMELENESQKDLEFKGAFKGLLCTNC